MISWSLSEMLPRSCAGARCLPLRIRVILWPLTAKTTEVSGCRVAIHVGLHGAVKCEGPSRPTQPCLQITEVLPSRHVRCLAANTLRRSITAPPTHPAPARLPPVPLREGRQPQSGPSKLQAARKESQLVHVELHWRRCVRARISSL